MNIIRAINARWGVAKPNISRGNKTTKDLGTRADIGWDNKIVEISQQKEKDNKQVEDPGRDDKKAGDLR